MEGRTPVDAAKVNCQDIVARYSTPVRKPFASNRAEPWRRVDHQYNQDICKSCEPSRQQHAFPGPGLSFSSQQPPERDHVSHLYHADRTDQHIIGGKHAHVGQQQQPADAELRNV
jgi:hypothetical protein